VFHVHNDYATQQGQHSRVRKRVAASQSSGTIPKRLERLFLPLFIQNRREVTKFENAGQPKARPVNGD